MHISKLSWDNCSRRCNDRRDFFSLAPSPHDEECTPAGEEVSDQIIEVKALIGQLMRIHGELPEGAEFVLIRNDHEFGTYYEAGIFYEMNEPNYDEEEEDEEETPSLLYAQKCESGIPDKWDAEALNEMKEAGHTKFLPKQPGKVVKHQGKVIPIKTETA
ncbi:MAG: hypothetical protein KBA90_14785 [Chitinophagaceae bacterium]|jgi:hypothetical protein|nr:hypothetical protein [Chitinophagaceae bacterium]